MESTEIVRDAVSFFKTHFDRKNNANFSVYVDLGLSSDTFRRKIYA